MSDLGPRDTGSVPIHRSEALTDLCLFFIYLSILDLNFTVCKDFFGSIRFLFIII